MSISHIRIWLWYSLIVYQQLFNAKAILVEKQ